jgi:Flp pilus assembly pilin Flp
MIRAISHHLKGQKGQALIEYTILTGLIGLAMVVTIANVADQIMDIWNDLMQDLDSIDDGVADSDLCFPQSDVDDCGTEDDTEEGGYRDEINGL